MSNKKLLRKLKKRRSKKILMMGAKMRNLRNRKTTKDKKRPITKNKLLDLR
jgi:hypothetical protein